MTADRLDLGDGHWLEYTSWAPDRELNPQYEGIPDEPRWGALVGHSLRSGDDLCAWRGGVECIASVTFDGPVQRQMSVAQRTHGGVNPEAPFWQIESWEPLTISPSLLCHCGDHGFIRGGLWVRA